MTALAAYRPDSEASGGACPALELLHDVAHVGQASQAGDARQKSVYFRLLPGAPQPGGWGERDEVTRAGRQAKCRTQLAPGRGQAGH
ncbi:MAG TPA: hypothetical protein VK898_08820, partial [Chloroflexota bacterium]|nr:hypothetical protein [Chloroflexota bacterium]